MYLKSADARNAWRRTNSLLLPAPQNYKIPVLSKRDPNNRWPSSCRLYNQVSTRPHAAGSA